MSRYIALKISKNLIGTIYLKIDNNISNNDIICGDDKIKEEIHTISKEKFDYILNNLTIMGVVDISEDNFIKNNGKVFNNLNKRYLCPVHGEFIDNNKNDYSPIVKDNKCCLWVLCPICQKVSLEVNL